MSLIEEKVEIVNELGLHARAAAKFVKEAGNFSCNISVVRDGTEINGKSIMGLMMLAAHKGSFINIKAEGDDSSEAVEALKALIANKFGEDR